MFGIISDERLDLLTLEQVRMRAWVGRQAAAAPSETKRHHDGMLHTLGGTGEPPAAAEADEGAEDDDYSWMDDMEAAPAASA